jgi:hypothetical protein
MNIPKYWAKAEQTIAIGRQTFHFVAWKGSDESLQDAQRQAQAALADRIARKERGEKLGQYPKDGAPLREEVLEQIFNPSGERIAVITRNAAGCLVLNTARVMFVDLDFANQYPTLRAAAKSFWEAVGGMFRRPNKAIKTQTPQDQLLEQVRNWHSQHPDWAMRVYRTRAGLRLLVAHDLFDPTTALVQQAMRELGADMRYMRLCQAQSCFRARLTPKPWRLKGGRMERPPCAFPGPVLRKKLSSVSGSEPTRAELVISQSARCWLIWAIAPSTPTPNKSCFCTTNTPSPRATNPWPKPSPLRADPN